MPISQTLDAAVRSLAHRLQNTYFISGFSKSGMTAQLSSTRPCHGALGPPQHAETVGAGTRLLASRRSMRTEKVRVLTRPPCREEGLPAGDTQATTAERSSSRLPLCRWVRALAEAVEAVGVGVAVLDLIVRRAAAAE